VNTQETDQDTSPEGRAADPAEFDAFADSYRECVDSTLGIAGENADYFAEGRVEWMRKVLADEPNINNVMDYGCGIGLGTPHLLTLPDVRSLVGVDVSERSLELGRAKFGSPQVRFASFAEYEPAAEIDLAVVCSVFHHIPLADRSAAMRYIYDSLRPGGLLALWEHNPWNPGVVYIMKHSPIDQDAIPVKPHLARRIVREGGFSVIRTDYQFIFPGPLRALRGLEPFLARWPIGAQYLVLARKD
jgi:SAM-dependent methyltransferase